MERGWNDFDAYLNTLAEEQLTTPTDAAGWTAKDHVIHLAIWEAGIFALLNAQPRWEGMGIDRETFVSDDFDRMNAVIQQRYRDMALDEVLKTFRDGHQRLVAKIQSMSDEDLQLPYRHYQPDSDRDAPVWHLISGNTFGHYEEHTPWIAAIVGEV
jgi:uncharacterized protein (TIGR03083 family)